jgi:hypothetical protein
MRERYNLHPAPAPGPDQRDPWRRRMRKTAEKLRSLDACRFAAPIARIEEYLRVDAGWNLDAALACSRRRDAAQS